MTAIVEDGRIGGVRVVVILHALMDKSIEDTAQAFGLSVEDVRAALAHACAVLQSKE